MTPPSPSRSPVVPCPSCKKGLPITVARYPEKGGTFPCPACREPLVLPPKAEFLAAFAAASAGAPPPPRETAGAEGEAPPSHRWIVALGGGAGVEEVDLDRMRELIRDGLVVGTTEVAPIGTRDYRPASGIPELTRWLAMAAEGRRVVYVRPPAATAETMVERAVQGLAYPFRAGALGTIIGLAVLSVIPVLSLLAGPLTSVWVIAAIRESARGDKTLPGSVDTSEIFEVLKVWMKTVLVSLIALWPMVGWALFWYLGGGDREGPEALTSLLVGLAIGALVSLVYYPACLATVAVWDSVLDSLNPAYVFRVIRTMGADYAIFLVAALLSWGAAIGLRILFGSLFEAIPLVGALPGHLATLWASLYAAHLLGWVIHRNEHDLGWN